MRTAAIVFVLLLLPTAAQAQFEGMLGGVNDVAISTTCGLRDRKTTHRDCTPGSAFGIELLWRLREIPRNGAKDVPERRKAATFTKTVRTVPRANGQGDSLVLVDSSYQYNIVAGRDTTITKWWIIEMALGYGQVANLTSGQPSYELRGAVRELPAFTVYVSFDGYRCCFKATPYLGLRSGLIDIQNLQAVDSVLTAKTTAYAASPKAFQLGGILGLAWGTPLIPLRLEAGYFVRDFASVQWSGSNVPSKLPRELSFSGWSLSIGTQFNLRDYKP